MSLEPTAPTLQRNFKENVLFIAVSFSHEPSPRGFPGECSRTQILIKYGLDGKMFFNLQVRPITFIPP